MIKRILISFLLFLVAFVFIYLGVVFITFDFNIENLKGEDRAIMLLFTLLIGCVFSMLYLFDYNEKK